MTEPKVGDRVRIVIEDEVVWVSPLDGALETRSTVQLLVGEVGCVSIEVIPPPFVLPTKRWAQVMDGVGCLWTRRWKDFDGDEWASLGGGLLSSSYLNRLSGLRVISEGVEE